MVHQAQERLRSGIGKDKIQYGDGDCTFVRRRVMNSTRDKQHHKTCTGRYTGKLLVELIVVSLLSCILHANGQLLSVSG